MMKYALLIAFVFSSLMTNAQNEIELNPVTVSASLQRQPVSTTGRNIVSISGKYFEQLPVHSIDELLRYIPGVEVQARGPMGSQSDIVIRGGTFQQVLVVLDGMRLNDPNTGHFSSYIPIAPVEIERIEVLKGAASAIYGSEAVGGVIHIISKSFAAKMNERKKQFAVQATGGAYGLWNVNAGGFYQNKKTAIAGGVSSNNADGQLQRGTRGYFNNNTVSVSGSHYFNKYWKLALRNAYDKRKFAAQNYYTTFKTDTAREAVESFWNQASLSYQKAKQSFVLEAGYKNVKDEYAFNSAGVPNKNISTLLQVNGRYAYRLTDKTTMITGLQYQGKSIRSNDRGNHHLNQVAGFIILNQKFGKRWMLTPALRLDHTEQSGTELVPQINASYSNKNIQLRASAGKTIRQADFTERYNNYNKALVTSGSIGNPDLQAERSFSYEAGADLFIKKELKLSSTVFRRELRRLIDWVTTPYSAMPRKDNLSPAGTYALASNIAKVNTTGFETDIQFSKTIRKTQQIFASAGIVWLDSKSSSGAASFYVSSHAKFMSNISVAYNNRRFGISANGIYKYRQVQSAPAINATISRDYFLMNVKAEGYLLKKQLSVFVEADNLFDKKYSDLLGAVMPGFWFMGGVKFQLGIENQ